MPVRGVAFKVYLSGVDVSIVIVIPVLLEIILSHRWTPMRKFRHIIKLPRLIREYNESGMVER